MFVHLETEQLNLHMDVDECHVEERFPQPYDFVHIRVYMFIHIRMLLAKVQYLSLFDDGECILLIKNGEILNEKTK